MENIKLVGFASLPADTFAEGPQSGADNGNGEPISANGRTGPFDGQPVQGFSGVQFAPGSEGDTFWFLSDNGFGNIRNSSDYLLRVYQVDPDFVGTEAGDGSVDVQGFVQLSDPDNLIPFEIVNEGTEERLLTGSDFDIESIVVTEDQIWIGEEFGPYLLEFDLNGVLQQAPIATPNIPTLNTLNGQEPIIIGHRGASGPRPEHTLNGFQLALEQGSDFIETDYVMTQDGVPIVRHEPLLNNTTDILDRPEFSDRETTKVIDGVEYTGFFAEDFTLEEIKTLRAKQPRPERSDAFDGDYEIPTMAEVIQLVKDFEAETGKKVGIVHELKHNQYFDSIGLNLEEATVRVLVEEDFTEPEQNIIQTFQIAPLIRLDNEIMPEAGIDVPLHQLTGNASENSSPGFSFPYDIIANFNNPDFTQEDAREVYGDLVDIIDLGADTGYGDLLALPEFYEFMATYAEAVNPWKNTILLREGLEEPVDGDGNGVAEIRSQLTGEIFPLIELAHDAGLLVNPYTLRDEERYLTLNPDGSVQTPTQEAEDLIRLGADGLIGDFPLTIDQVRDQIVADEVRSPQNPDLQFNTLTGEPPLVIGHRGASGERPEHTLEAYERAIAQGADFIEPDLAITKDGVLIARHEPLLDDTTNVAEVFGPERQSTKILDGEVITGFFAEDFTLEEIKTLRAVQPRSYRDQSFNGLFEIPTLAEVIELVQQVEAETGVKVGIYPETKHPEFFDQEGLSLEEPLVETLIETGFTDRDRIFIQSFELQNLIELQEQLDAEGLGDLPLVQLFGDTEGSFINEGGGGFSVPYDFVANFGDRAVDSLEFLGIDLIDGDLTVDGTEVGGLSGLGLQPGTTDTYYAISDDYQGSDARFYNLAIDLSDGSLDQGDITIDSETSDPVFFLDTDGTTFTSDEVGEINRGLDAEGLAFLPNGNLLLSSEGRGVNADPFIREYTLDGTLVAEIPVDEKHLSTLDPENFGVRGSGGFESLTITPDNEFLFAGNEKTLIQDGPEVDYGQIGLSRIVKYDLETSEPIAEFVYEVTTNTLIPEDENGNPDLEGGKGSGLVELLAVDENRLFALEREFAAGVTNGEGSRPVRLYEIDLSGATNVITEDSLEDVSFSPVSKRLLLDFDQLLGESDIERIGSMEALAFGPDLPDGRKVLLVMEDNDFSAEDGDRDTQVVAFGINPYEFDQAEAEAIYGEELANLIDFSASPTYEDLANAEAIDAISNYAEGLGPWKNNILLREGLEEPVDGNGDGVAEITTQLTGEVFPLIDFAHDAGLQIHPYTLRDEERFLTLNSDGTPQTPEQEVEQLIELGVDGFFTDFPATGRIVVDQQIELPNLSRTRGYEGMAYSPDLSTLYPLLEGSVVGDPENALRIYEADAETGEFTDLIGFYPKDEPNHAIGDFTPINETEFLVIERDGGQGESAEFKKVFKIDLSEIDENRFVEKEELVNLLNIEDPDDLNGDGETTFTFPFVTIEDVLVLDETTILVANDNNYPFSVGRGPDIDNNEIIQLELPEPLDVDPRIIPPFPTDGDDILTGSADSDTIAGLLGDDDISGGEGDDVLRGDLNNRSPQVGTDGGNDTITGGSGDDNIGGKAGDDELFGGDGNDAIWGDDGDDLIRGGLGDDTLTGDDFSGGQGSDTFVLAIGEGTDTITDFEVGIDLIGLAEGLTFAELSISGNTISVGDETLATVVGVSELTEADFELV